MIKQFTLTKRIAKHGNQAIIVIPRLIEKHLKPGTIVEVRIDVMKNKVIGIGWINHHIGVNNRIYSYPN